MDHPRPRSAELAQNCYKTLTVLSTSLWKTRIAKALFAAYSLALPQIVAAAGLETAPMRRRNLLRWSRAVLHRRGNRPDKSGAEHVANLKALVVNATLFTPILALGGCNTPSIDDFQRIERAVAELQARVEAAEARTSASAASADLALDSAGQCGQVCLQVSDRLDELYLEITPR
jgi:hypothetical protein